MEVSIFVRTQKDLPYPQFINLHEFLKQQHDVISLHVPLTPETNFMLKDDEFALMKKGVIIINTARPQLICVKAMTKALAREIVRGFAIDGDYDLVAPFTRIDKKNKGIITHHIADCTIEAQANITRQALVQMVAFFEKNEVINRVI